MALFDYFQALRQHVVGPFFPSSWYFDIAPFFLVGILLCGVVGMTYDLPSELVIMDQRKFQEIKVTLHCNGLDIETSYMMKRSSVKIVRVAIARKGRIRRED